jgi:hypothetical protein
MTLLCESKRTYTSRTKAVYRHDNTNIILFYEAYNAYLCSYIDDFNKLGVTKKVSSVTFIAVIQGPPRHEQSVVCMFWNWSHGRPLHIWQAIE